jgi:hypothetical protein
MYSEKLRKIPPAAVFGLKPYFKLIISGLVFNQLNVSRFNLSQQKQHYLNNVATAGFFTNKKPLPFGRGFFIIID